MQPVELLNKHLGAIVGVPLAAGAGYAVARMNAPTPEPTVEQMPVPTTNMANEMRLQLLQQANAAPSKSDKDYYLRLTQLPDEKLIALAG